MTTQTDQNNGTTDYFDLHVSGFGYVNRVREVQVKRGETFWACDIAALHGATDDTQYTYFDCRISGSEAEGLIKRYEKPITDGNKVLIGFKLGDLYAETFVYEKGKKQGEAGVSLKARLLFISWIKVDGDTVYKAPRKTGAGQTDTETPAAEGEAPKPKAETEQNAAAAA